MKDLGTQTKDQLVELAYRRGFKNLPALMEMPKRELILLLRGKPKALARYADWNTS